MTPSMSRVRKARNAPCFRGHLSSAKTASCAVDYEP